jgi:signal transduction histidine kinase/FixJ family two-component response regulator/HPt (histidine-containing phosphotransfer) domain-containing protein
MLVLLAVVATSGILAYRSLSAIVDSSGTDTLRDSKRLALKNILSDLADAGNSVHSYSLVKDSAYLQPFYSSLISVDEKLNRLSQLYASDAVHRDAVDSLSYLVAEKYEILRKFLTLHDDQRIVESLQLLAGKMHPNETVNKGPAGNDIPEPVKKESNIFQRIFGKHNKTGEDTVAQKEPVMKEKPINVKEMQGALLKVKEEQLKQLQELNERELLYTKEDKAISDRISALASGLEKHEMEMLTASAKSTEEKMNRTNREIAIFCVVAALLLLLMAVVIAVYIRKNREYSKALALAKTEAENLARAKENFLAVMSHEIRTPMNAVAGFTEQLLQTDLDQEQRKQLEVIRRSGEHLLRIINDVLDFSKLSSGKFTFHREPFSPVNVLDEVVQFLQPVADKKKIALRLQLDHSMPSYVEGDELRLKQVVLNLASNAVKFTDRGEVVISASARARVGDELLLLIHVSDTGIGIPAEKLPHIFNEFEQGDTSISAKYGGTGLGLSITKKMVELQSGKIEVRSRNGGGTEVRVTLPYRVAEKPEEKKPESLHHELLEGKSVLVVDDEEFNRLLLASILKKWKVDMEEAGDAKEALKKIDESSFDAILMDIHLPGMDGKEITKRIRERKDKNSNVPVIALTASAPSLDTTNYAEAGFDDMLSKPFNERDLYRKLLQCMKVKIEKKERTNMKKEKKTAGTDKNGSGRKYDLDSLLRLSNGDTRFFKEMIRTFISSTGEGVDFIVKYAGEKNWEKVAHYTHKISAPCKHLSTQVLLEYIQEIERLAKQNREDGSMPGLVQKMVEEKNILMNQLENELARLG